MSQSTTLDGAARYRVWFRYLNGDSGPTEIAIRHEMIARGGEYLAVRMVAEDAAAEHAFQNQVLGDKLSDARPSNALRMTVPVSRVQRREKDGAWVDRRWPVPDRMQIRDFLDDGPPPMPRAWPS